MENIKEEKSLRIQRIVNKFTSIAEYISFHGLDFTQNTISGLDKAAEQLLDSLEINGEDVTTIVGEDYICPKFHTFTFKPINSTLLAQKCEVPIELCNAIQDHNRKNGCVICTIVQKYAQNGIEVEYYDDAEITESRIYYQFRCKVGHLFGHDISKIGDISGKACPVCELLQYCNNLGAKYIYESGCYTNKLSNLIFCCLGCKSSFNVSADHIYKFKEKIRCTERHLSYLPPRTRHSIEFIEYIFNARFSDNITIKKGISYEPEQVFYSDKLSTAFIIDENRLENNDSVSTKFRELCKRRKINLYFIVRKRTTPIGKLYKFIWDTLSKNPGYKFQGDHTKVYNEFHKHNLTVQSLKSLDAA